MIRLITVLLLLLFLSSISPAVEKPDPYRAEIQKANTYIRAKQIDDAIETFKKAVKQGPDCAWEAHVGLAQLQSRISEFKKAAEAFERALLCAPAEHQAALHNARAVALFNGREKKKLPEAEREARRATELKPDLAVAHLNLGMILMRQKRDAEGAAVLQRFLEIEPSTSRSQLARRYIANPNRVRDAYLPEFEVTTLSGQTLSTASLEGKVVLIDFWATWCGPCVNEVPAIKKLRQKYNRPDFIILSLSQDRDRQKWQQFVEKNEMNWEQHLDEGARVFKLLSGVSEETTSFCFTVPTYVLVDRDGKMAKVGNHLASVQGDVKKLLEKDN